MQTIEYKTVKFLTCGNVDDGKSTLVGRLLYDLGVIPEDQIANAKDIEGNIDYSLFTDGLEDERRQGITIDVAYRYFRYGDCRYRIADTPGHIEYMRNMAVAALGSDIAVIVVDVVGGIKMQTIEYSKIARFFGVRTFLVAVNKMDKVNYNQEKFQKIKQEYLQAFANENNDCEINFIPVSASQGDNIITNSNNTLWYDGLALFKYLQNIKPVAKSNDNLCLPIQHVIRGEDKKRWYLGTLQGAPLCVGSSLVVADKKRPLSVISIYHGGQPIQQAEPTQAIAVQIAEDIDITRGDTLVSNNYDIPVVDSFDTKILWMNKPDVHNREELVIQGIIKFHHKEALVQIKVNNNTSGVLKPARAQLSIPIALDIYSKNPHAGLFIIIDSCTKSVIMVGTVEKCF